MSKREWTVGLLATGAVTKIKVGDRSFVTTANDLLGGSFERVRFSADYGILVDESGLLKGLPYNKIASLLYGTPIHGAPIVGDAFACSEDYVYDDGFPELDLVWLTEEQADEFILFLPEAYKTPNGSELERPGAGMTEEVKKNWELDWELDWELLL